jgi:hypothetical protein
MDRTNWRWGKKDINILMLAVAYKGAAIPIYWMLLNKKSNSSTLERKVLVNRFIKQFGKKHILGLLVDREFIGKKWFEWLKAQEIDFVIRIKKDAKTSSASAKFSPCFCKLDCRLVSSQISLVIMAKIVHRINWQ